MHYVLEICILGVRVGRVWVGGCSMAESEPQFQVSIKKRERERERGEVEAGEVGLIVLITAIKRGLSSPTRGNQKVKRSH